MKEREFLLDGELIITAGDVLAFEALQLRLHPAESRVRKLAGETPAELMAFDLLDLGGKSLIEAAAKPSAARLSSASLRRTASAGLLLSPDDHRPRHRSRMAAPQRRRARRGGRQAARPALPAWRAGDGQGQAAAHRRLRRRRLPLCRKDSAWSGHSCWGSMMTTACSITSASPRRFPPKNGQR